MGIFTDKEETIQKASSNVLCNILLKFSDFFSVQSSVPEVLKNSFIKQSQ